MASSAGGLLTRQMCREPTGTQINNLPHKARFKMYAALGRIACPTKQLRRNQITSCRPVRYRSFQSWLGKESSQAAKIFRAGNTQTAVDAFCLSQAIKLSGIELKLALTNTQSKVTFDEASKCL